jgi:hypothetical protein
MLKKELIFIIFLLSIPLSFAIYNVSHSTIDNQVTLTYDGNPPFYINIRNDQNIGDFGGYLWAKTNLKSFTYDMSYAINPSKTFYYGVKDSEWSEISDFSIGESLNQECVSLLNNGLPSSKIDLILIPDAYLTIQEMNDFVLTTKEYLGLIGNEGLFNIEPFKSNKDKFNIYYINKTVSLGGCYHQSNTCDYNQIEELKEICPSIDEVIVIFNNDHYDTQYTHKAFANTCNHFATAIGHSNINGFIFNPNQLAHEFGHSFGCLKDLYFTQRYDYINPNWPNIDVFGCPKWCDGETLIPEPNNKGCTDFQTESLCETADFYPKCEWFPTLNKCLPLPISGACSIYYDESTCIDAYNDLSNFKCKWYPLPDGYCGIEGGIFNVNLNCNEDYGCYQGAEGLDGYGPEPTRDTIMGGMIEMRFDIASHTHLLNLLSNYSN